jgi:hypothetical protein
VSTALFLGAGAIAAANVCLIAICIRRQTALGGIAGVAGLGLLIFAASRGVAGDALHAALILALVFLIVGTALLALGQLLERLLDRPPPEGES